MCPWNDKHVPLRQRANIEKSDDGFVLKYNRRWDLNRNYLAEDAIRIA